jgi:hypothetical protein
VGVTIYPRQAAETLDELAALRRRLRRSLGQPWFPPVCFGAVTVASAPLVAAVGTVVLLPLWIVAGIVGMHLTRRHFARRARLTGVYTRAGGVWVVSVAMFLLCLLAGVAAGLRWGEAGGTFAPIVVVLLGYAVLAWLQRNALVLALVLLCAVAGAVPALSGQRAWLVALIFGAALMLAGGMLSLVQRVRMASR